MLHSNVAFIGLNRSGKEERNAEAFSNFHTAGHRGDLALRQIIQDGNLANLVGGFMTDLSGKIETDSTKVSIDEASFLELQHQLEMLEPYPKYLICFGSKAFTSLSKYWNARVTKRLGIEIAETARTTLAGVYHYSMNGFNNRNVIERLPNQLATIDKWIR